MILAGQPQLAALCTASKNSGSFGFVKAAQQPFGAASSLSTAWAHGTLCGEDPKPFRLSESLEAARPERDSSAGSAAAPTSNIQQQRTCFARAAPTGSQSSFPS